MSLHCRTCTLAHLAATTATATGCALLLATASVTWDTRVGLSSQRSDSDYSKENIKQKSKRKLQDTGSCLAICNKPIYHLSSSSMNFFLCHHAGTYCGKFPNKPVRWMHDNFEDGGVLKHWARVEGAAVGQGCGIQKGGNTLLFSGPGHRMATTQEVDTRAIRCVFT